MSEIVTLPDYIRDMAEREFSQEYRQELAEEGFALPDGSYPIPDCDALRRAIQSYGRETSERRAELRRHIAKRKAALGCPEVSLPDTWAMKGAE